MTTTLTKNTKKIVSEREMEKRKMLQRIYQTKNIDTKIRQHYLFYANPQNLSASFSN